MLLKVSLLVNKLGGGGVRTGHTSGVRVGEDCDQTFHVLSCWKGWRGKQLSFLECLARGGRETGKNIYLLSALPVSSAFGNPVASGVCSHPSL